MNERCMHAYKFRFTEKYILFGMSENIKTDKICDFITLMAKFYIYKSKVQHTELNVNCLYYKAEIYDFCMFSVCFLSGELAQIKTFI